MTMTFEAPSWQQPSHPNLIKVHKISGQFASYATSLVSLSAGSLFAPFTDHLPMEKRTWRSVEAANGIHIDLNSDLFFANHSCSPSLEYDVDKLEVRVSRNKDLHEGDVLTFFYPSTEWHIVQEFECNCNQACCLGKIMGAGELGIDKLKGYWLNTHIVERLEKQAEKK